MPTLLPLLERHRHLEVDAPTRDLPVRASVATVERNLVGLRHGLVARKLSQTKPGSLLRRQIPVVVGQWKALDQPGYLEIDIVSHSGEIAAGKVMKLVKKERVGERTRKTHDRPTTPLQRWSPVARPTPPKSGR